MTAFKRSWSFIRLDDLGVEPAGRFYGQDCNVMGEILLSRYELFLSHKIRTHHNLIAQHALEIVWALFDQYQH